MLLNYRLRTSKVTNKTIPIIMIHGLFGNLSNLGVLSTFLAQYHDVIQIDLRNHGKSPHDSIMTYAAMAQDILNLLYFLAIKKCIIIGHSIGGKVAMALSILADQYVDKVIVIDIAPKKYNVCRHQNIFSILNYINNSKITNKNDIIKIMEQNYIKPHIILFLLKSFQKGKWSFNFDFIMKNYHNINDWSIPQICYQPSLFIKGALSSYINDSCIKNIYYQFPSACIKTVSNSGHWVHHDEPIHVFNIIKKFILKGV